MPTVQPAYTTLTSDPTAVDSLSPDALMAYCDTRLSSLDSQMQAIFTQQTQSAATTEDLDGVASLLNSLPASTSSDTIVASGSDVSNITAAYTKAIEDLSPTNGTPSQMYAAGAQTALGGELAQDLAAFSSSVSYDSSGTPNLPESVISNLSSNLKNYTSNLNSDAEMQMVNLQSLMSSRQTAVELSTNMMQTLASTDDAIASNFKDG